MGLSYRFCLRTFFRLLEVKIVDSQFLFLVYFYYFSLHYIEINTAYGDGHFPYGLVSGK